MAHDSDETVRLRPRRPGRRLVLGCALCAAASAGGAAWLIGHREAAPAPSPPAAPAAPRIPVTTAGEADILAHQASVLDVFRFDRNPRVLVLDFASLHRQGAMLNRIAALAEKNGAPHDRVLDDADLARTIAASGTTPDTFYYGHDYGTLELNRFFACVDQAHLPLSPEEAWLRDLVVQEQGDDPSRRMGLISIPAVSADVTADMRHTILHHELSHGEFFTNPDYADWSQEFWEHRLDAPGREVFRRFLVAEGYDPTLQTLLINETQAYLMFTPSRTFFSATALGVSDAAVAEWREAFREGMPPGWLKEAVLF